MRVLALRDELVGRDFDDPDAWWSDVPGTVGGRDRSAGGTWCVTHVPTATTGLVLNRPQRPQADPGAPSRGVLPLLAVEHGADWPGAVRLEGMASFSLVLVTPERLACWAYDGTELVREELPEGTSMLTSGGEEDGRAVRHLEAFRESPFPDGWLGQLRETQPSPDRASLVVRGEHEGKVFATVFGQVITAAPGELRLAWSREPWGDHAWTSRTWRTADGVTVSPTS